MASLVVEGFAQEPKQSVSASGKPVLTVSVAQNERRYNDQSKQWENVKDRDGNDIMFWARASFWEDEATFLATQVSKGTFVRIEGEPRIGAYIDKNGVAVPRVDIRKPALSIVPRQQRAQRGASGAGGAGMGSWSSEGTNGAQGGFQGGGFDEEKPF